MRIGNVRYTFKKHFKHKEIIKYYLKEKRISQKELAEKLGETQQSISRKINANDMWMSDIFKIANALDLKPYHLFIKINDTVNSSEDYLEKINHVIQLEKKIKDLEEKLEEYKKKATYFEHDAMVKTDDIECHLITIASLREDIIKLNNKL